jgi:hypothetical protein
MDHIGIDVHTKHSQICLLTEDGELIERRVRTWPNGLARCWAGARERAPFELAQDFAPREPPIEDVHAANHDKRGAPGEGLRGESPSCGLCGPRPETGDMMGSCAYGSSMAPACGAGG